MDSSLHENRGPEMLAAIYSVATLAVLCVIARISSRRLMGAPLKADDYIVVVGLILTWACCICTTLSVKVGIGRHLAVIPDFSEVNFFRILYAYNQIYVATGPTIKIGVLLMYRRIFVTPRFLVVTKVMVVLIIIWWLGESLLGVFTCIPVNGYWDVNVPAKCISLLNYDIGYAVINISFDVAILSLPVPMIWRLKTSRAQKFALTIAFGLGGFTCITALIRLLSAILNVDSPDLTWVYADALIWTAIEPAVGVISACLPAMRPILSILFPKHFMRRTNAPRYEVTPPADSKRPNRSNSNWLYNSQFKRLDNSYALTTIESDMKPLNLDRGTGRNANAGVDAIAEGEIHVTTDVDIEQTSKTSV